MLDGKNSVVNRNMVVMHKFEYKSQLHITQSIVKYSHTLSNIYQTFSSRDF